MHRPTRQHRHLAEKVATKRARSRNNKPGRKTKKWNKWIALYAPLVQEAAAPAGG